MVIVIGGLVDGERLTRAAIRVVTEYGPSSESWFIRERQNLNDKSILAPRQCEEIHSSIQVIVHDWLTINTITNG